MADSRLRLWSKRLGWLLALWAGGVLAMLAGVALLKAVMRSAF